MQFRESFSQPGWVPSEIAQERNCVQAGVTQHCTLVELSVAGVEAGIASV